MGVQIAAGAAAATLYLLAVYRVRQRNWPRAALGFMIATGLVVWATGVLPTAEDAREGVEDAADSLGLWLYPFIAGVAVLESFPPPFCAVWPGEFAVIFAGALAARDHGEIELVPLLAIVWASSAVADSASFALGRRFGRDLLVRHGPAFRVTPERLDRLDRWFDRYGTTIVALGRLLPVARPLGPFVAGSSALPYHRFLRWNLLGVTLFTAVFCLLGYVFYDSYDELVQVIGRVGLAVLVLALVVVLVVARRRRRRA
jgi:membrane protein DedA with SNARE-associated domain